MPKEEQMEQARLIVEDWLADSFEAGRTHTPDTAMFCSSHE